MSYYSSGSNTQQNERESEHDAEENVDLMNEESDAFANERPLPPEPLEIAGKRQSSVRGKSRAILVCGKTYPRRYIGLCSALICGTWGGSCLVPMHYAKGGNTSGLGYVISFSVGALVVTIFAWFVRFSYHFVRLKSLWEAYEVLPPAHLKVMWLPGAIAGVSDLQLKLWRCVQ